MNTKMTKTIMFAGLLATMLMPLAHFSVEATNENIKNNKSISLTEKWNDSVPDSIKNYKTVTLDSIQLRDQIDNNEVVTISYNDVNHELVLSEFQFRAPDSKAYITENGQLIEVPKEDLRAFNGYVKDARDTTVYVLTSPDYFSAVINTGDKDIRVEPLRNYDRSADPSLHIIYEIEAQQNVQATQVDFDGSNTLIPNAYASTTKYAGIIMDCDVEFFNLYPSNWQFQQGEMLLTSFDVYDDANLSFFVKDNVCDTDGSRYTAATIEDRLAQLQNYWDEKPNTRDFVMLASGYDFVGGEIGVTPHVQYPIADTANYAYLVAQRVADNNGNSQHSGSLANAQIVVAHEIGHIFGALPSNAEVVNPSNPPTYTIMKEDVWVTQLAALLSNDNVTIVDNAAHAYL